MNIYDFDINELINICTKNGYKPYRAKQLFSGLHLGKTPESITTLPNSFIAALSQKYDFNPIKIEKHLKAEDGTEKFIFGLFDGNIIESVLMKYSYIHYVFLLRQVVLWVALFVRQQLAA